ncbi:MAG: TusE/DsrC/DsvC family sulfur relay protein [Thermodesulfobacteriota bacterium]
MTASGNGMRLDAEGFLENPEDWSEDAAQALARLTGLDRLTERHWRVIRFLRSFYQEQGRAPLNNQIKKGTGLSIMEIEELFPGGVKRGARRIAGLPNPKTCM